MLAVLLHLEAGLGFGLWAYFHAPREADRRASGNLASEDDSIDFGVLDEEASRKIIAEMEVAEEKREEEEKRKEEETVKPSGQVVEMARPREEQRPDDARFVSEYDSKVAKEMRKFGELDKKAVQGAQNGPDDVTTPPSPAQAAQAAQKASPAGARTPALAMNATPSAEKAAQPGTGPAAIPGNPLESEPGAPPGDGRELAVGQLLRTRPSPQQGGGGAGTPEIAGAEALMPTQQQVARSIGSGTSDHLEGVEEGTETALNARKWKFASFFNRVKQQVREQWRPAEEYRKRDPNFRIYGQRDRFTLLRVELKPDGSLANVIVESPSGVEFLDDEAIEAFKLAQPFPNPPYQLIEKGAISFGFGFFFEIGGGPVPRMKTFRYNDF